MVGAAKFAEAVLRLEKNHKEFAIRHSNQIREPITSTVPQGCGCRQRWAARVASDYFSFGGRDHRKVVVKISSMSNTTHYGFLRGHTRVKDWAPSFDRSWPVRNDILFLSHAYVLLIGPSRHLRYGNPRILVARFFLFPESRSKRNHLVKHQPHMICYIDELIYLFFFSRL